MMFTQPHKSDAKKLCLLALALLVTQALALLAMGRLWVCDCESVKLWYGNAYGPENSQQFFDPYTFSHVTHGLIFFLLLIPLRIPWWKKFLIATGIEVSWEILENTPMVIDRYRSATVSFAYYGDTILNSVMDTVAMMGGFLLATKGRVWGSILMIVLLEIILLFWIADNLLLNIIMLIYPLDFILEWQSSFS